MGTSTLRKSSGNWPKKALSLAERGGAGPPGWLVSPEGGGGAGVSSMVAIRAAVSVQQRIGEEAKGWSLVRSGSRQHVH